jgi:hypothetical protein
MSNTCTIGIDTAKRVFFLHDEDAGGKVVLREKLTRERLLPFLANRPVSMIAIEATHSTIRKVSCRRARWARHSRRIRSRRSLMPWRTESS